MKTTRSRRRFTELPALAQNPTGVLAFLFNIVNLLTQVFNLFALFQEFFGRNGDDMENGEPEV